MNRLVDRIIHFLRFAACLVLFVPSARSAEPIFLASIFAHTGQAAFGNILSIKGSRFAVQEINTSGGLLGRPVILKEYDNLSSPIGAKKAAENAVADKACAIIGADWSSHSLAAAKVAQTHRIPMITNISTHPDVTLVGDCIFRACFTDRFQGWIMANFARSWLKSETGVIFTDIASDFSLGLTREIRRHYEADGGRILAEISYKHRQESFLQPALQAKNADPDVFFLSGHDESALILKALARQKATGIPIGSDGWGSRSFLEKGGGALKIGYYCTHWSQDALETESARHFVETYPHTDIISPQEALAYDAVMLWRDAVRRAQSTDREAIRNALANTRNFQGVTGAISFDANGDPVKPAVVMKIENGTPKFLLQIHPPTQD